MFNPQIGVAAPDPAADANATRVALTAFCNALGVAPPGAANNGTVTLNRLNEILLFQRIRYNKV